MVVLEIKLGDRAVISIYTVCHINIDLQLD